MGENTQNPNRKAKDSHPSKVALKGRRALFAMHVRDVLLLSFLAFVVFLVYSNTLGSPFTFDDTQNIQDNTHIRLTSLGLGAITKAGFESPSPNRPIPNISFALNYYVHRYHVLGYHLVNILIHVTTGILLYLFVKTTLTLPSLRSRYESHRWIPFVTALVWLVHPVQTQSVTYIVQRMNSMAAMFYVLSFFLYVKGRLAEEKRGKWALFSGSILAGILSLGSKEIAATLPFFIFLYEWYFFQDLSWPWLKRHVLPLAALFILLAIVVFMYLGVHPFEKILNTYATRDFTLNQRVLTEFRVVIYYISLLIFPHPSRLNLDRDFPLSHSLTDPITTVLSMGGIAVLVGLAIYLAKKDRLLSFCILWFLGNLVIESSVIGLEIIFEHRTYLPSMLVTLVAVTLACGHIKPKRWKMGVLCGVVMLFSLWTYQRNSIWTDRVTLWKDCVEKSPKKARPHLNLGYALHGQGNYKDAMTQYYEALRIKPRHAKVHNNLGALLKNQGEFEDAISHFYEALRIKPDYAEAHNNLAVALAGQERFNEAISHYSQVLQVEPTHAAAHNNLGVVLVKQGKLKEAMSHYTEALRIDPDYAEAHYNMGNALKNRGKFREAMHHFSEAVRIKPDYAKAHNNLGVVLVREGRFKEATNHYLETLRITPDYEEAHFNMANALVKQGRLKEASSHYFEALKIKPDYAEAYNNLGAALARQGSLIEAINHFSEAVRIKPDYEEARQNLERSLRLSGKSGGASDPVPRP